MGIWRKSGKESEKKKEKIEKRERRVKISKSVCESRGIHSNISHSGVHRS